VRISLLLLLLASCTSVRGDSCTANMTQYSAGCQQIIDTSAQISGGQIQVSEYLLLAFVQDPGCTVSRWLIEEGVDLNVIRAEILALPWIAPAAAGAPPPSGTSPTYNEVLQLAAAVHDIARSAYPGSISQVAIKSEHLFAGIMLHPKSIARHIVESTTDGAITSRTLLAALDIASKSFRERLASLKASWPRPWQERTIGGPVVPGTQPRGGGALPAVVTAELQQMRGPTTESNWLVRGRVALGEWPGSYTGNTLSAVEAILDAGVDTFVCLLEWDGDYAEHVQQALQQRSQLQAVTLLWFPIDDFSTADDDDTMAFVEELGRRVATGSNLYIHCYSGRGRTGTVAIPLFMSMYPELLEAGARELVNLYKKHGRTGSTRGGHMPEDPAQLEQIAEHTMEYKRGGHKAKH